MTRYTSTAAARRTVTSSLVALVLAAVLPHAGFAATPAAGMWKIDPAHSRFSSGYATLSINQVGVANPNAGRFVVISNGNVYLVTGANADDSKGLKPVDYARMTDGKAVLIGTNARSTGLCGFRCQSGLPDRRMTVTFKAVTAGEQQIKNMLAYEGQKE